MFWIFLAKMNECSGHFGTQKFLKLISLAKHCKKITLTFFELFYYYFLVNRCKTSTVLRKSSIICNIVFPVHHQIISVDTKIYEFVYSVYSRQCQICCVDKHTLCWRYIPHSDPEFTSYIMHYIFRTLSPGL